MLHRAHRVLGRSACQVVISGVFEVNARHGPSRSYADWIEREQLEEAGFDKKPAYKRVKEEVEMVIRNSSR